MSARYTRAMPLVLRGLSVVMPQDFGVARQVGFHWLGKTAARGDSEEWCVWSALQRQGKWCLKDRSDKGLCAAEP